MDAVKTIEVSLSQDKISLINRIYQKELNYWKEVALTNALDEYEANQLKDSEPLSFILVRKATKNGKKTVIDEIILYLKSQYLVGKTWITFIQRYNVANSVEKTFEEIKVMSKCIKEGDNMGLKNNALFGKWLSHANESYKYIKKKDMLRRFEDWIY